MKHDPNVPLLEARDVSRIFEVRHGLLSQSVENLRAVDEVSLTVARGETLGLVGESGCGKSTLGRMLIGLLPPSSGDILFEGVSLRCGTTRCKDGGHGGQTHNDSADAPEQALCAQNNMPGATGALPRKSEAPCSPTPCCTPLRPGRMQMVFQDPFSSLNPRLSVGASVGEPLGVENISRSERRERVAAMLRKVGLDPDLERRYPHEFSGGQRQRVAIARALITKPDLVVCDEAVSALDASVQAQVLNLLKDIQSEFHPAYVFISHDLNVVGYMCGKVAVMYLGRVVESASRDTLFARPAHPYARILLAASPSRYPSQTAIRRPLRGEPPSPLNPPTGCAFHPRCPDVMDICHHVAPAEKDLGEAHLVRCHLYN